MLILANSEVFNTSLPGIIFIGFEVITMLAAALAVARASFIKAQVETLRADRDDHKERIVTLEHENELLTKDLKAERERRQALELVVTGKQELQAVVELLKTHDDHLKKVEGLIYQIRRS